MMEEEEDDDLVEDPKNPIDPRAKEERHARLRAMNNPDLRAHQHTLIILLVSALQSLVSLMAALKEQRTERLRQEVEQHHPGAIERQRKTLQSGSGSDSAGEDAADADLAARSPSSRVKDLFSPTALTSVVNASISKVSKKLGVAGGGKDGEGNNSMNGTPGEGFSGLASSPLLSAPLPPPVLSASETVQLLAENHQLHDSLQENLDQIRKAEGKMAEISQMLALFSAKVLEQEEQIDTIYDQAIQSTLHVHSGISQLKKAAQRGVTFRMMILFMILMLSFSLLFLDWYMP